MSFQHNIWTSALYKLGTLYCNHTDQIPFQRWNQWVFIPLLCFKWQPTSSSPTALPYRHPRVLFLLRPLLKNFLLHEHTRLSFRLNLLVFPLGSHSRVQHYWNDLKRQCEIKSQSCLSPLYLTQWLLNKHLLIIIYLDRHRLQWYTVVVIHKSKQLPASNTCVFFIQGGKLWEKGDTDPTNICLKVKNSNGKA